MAVTSFTSVNFWAVLLFGVLALSSLLQQFAVDGAKSWGLPEPRGPKNELATTKYGHSTVESANGEIHDKRSQSATVVRPHSSATKRHLLRRDRGHLPLSSAALGKTSLARAAVALTLTGVVSLVLGAAIQSARRKVPLGGAKDSVKTGGVGESRHTELQPLTPPGAASVPKLSQLLRNKSLIYTAAAMSAAVAVPVLLMLLSSQTSLLSTASSSATPAGTPAAESSSNGGCDFFCGQEKTGDVDPQGNGRSGGEDTTMAHGYMDPVTQQKPSEDGFFNRAAATAGKYVHHFGESGKRLYFQAYQSLAPSNRYCCQSHEGEKYFNIMRLALDITVALGVAMGTKWLSNVLRQRARDRSPAQQEAVLKPQGGAARRFWRA